MVQEYVNKNRSRDNDGKHEMAHMIRHPEQHGGNNRYMPRSLPAGEDRNHRSTAEQRLHEIEAPRPPKMPLAPAEKAKSVKGKDSTAKTAKATVGKKKVN